MPRLFAFVVLFFGTYALASDHRSRDGAPRVEAACADDATLTAWCDIKNPEDLALTPDGDFLLTTAFGGLPVPVASKMMLVDLRTMKKSEIEIVLGAGRWGDPKCTRTTTDFSTHGLDVVKRADDKYMVAVTNHLPTETVELFELLPRDGSWYLRWRGCVGAPLLEAGARYPLFNDVALKRDGSFYVTEMYNGKMPFPELLQAGRDGKNTGQVWFWSPDSGLSALTGSDGGFPNGIAINAAENTLYVNYWFSGKTVKIDIASGQIEATHLAGRADNLTIANGSLYAAKHDMSIDEYVTNCGGDTVNCFLPFTIYELDMATLAEKNVWQFDSKAFGFATVALPVDGRMWLGSAHSDRLAAFAY